MPKIQEKQKQIVEQFQQLTKQELHALDNELEKYSVTKPLELHGKSKDVTYLDNKGMIRWFYDNGATNEKFFIKDIPKFRYLQNKLEQYSTWIRKKEFAIRMNDENYRQIVEEQLGTQYTDF